MKEIKIGDYIRTQNGLIGKLEEINKEPTDETITYIVTDNFLGIIDEIKKHSPNIIDLIEVGDVIRTEYLLDTHIKLFGKYHITHIEDKELLESIKIGFKDKSLKLLGILTKEKIEDIEYRLEK